MSTITELTDAELDSVAAAGNSINVVGLFVAIQGNASAQTSANLVTAFSGNQLVVQSNNASVG